MTPKLERINNDWRSLTDSLHSLREDEVWELLKHEMAHKKRQVHLRRLHQRASSMRAARERKELLCL